jgi:arabinan endo-1,5-alpha-L-arabinosidase
MQIRADRSRRAATLLSAVITVLVLSSCGVWTVGTQTRAGSDAGSTERTTESTAAVTSTDESTSLVEQASSANPVLDLDFPDPYAVSTSDGYRAFATNSRGLNVPVAQSRDLATWTQLGDALPDLPSWVKADSVWAPSVQQVGDGFVMYVTVGDLRRGRQCIFVATSDVIDGPYVLTDQPLACGAGGSIDASPSTDAAGITWLTWKDEAADGSPAQIRSVSLTRDGLRLAGVPVTLLCSEDVQGGDTVEGPSLVPTEYGYLLFFSVGDWTTNAYRTGYATCSSPSGPCEVQSSEWLTSATSGTGPGGLEVFAGTDRGVYVTYHTWSRSRRVLNIDALEIGADGTPVLAQRASSQAQ